jgi:hypothetical protein
VYLGSETEIEDEKYPGSEADIKEESTVRHTL